MNAAATDGEDVVTASLAGRFMVTLGHPMRSFERGEPAPSGLHWCLAPEYGVALGPDGIAPDGIIPALDLPRRLWAGATIRARAPLRIGDTVRRRSRVLDVARKTGRSGPLAFARIGHSFTVDGEVRIEEEQVIAYRAGAVRAETPAGEARPPAGLLLRRVPTDPAMLFRFSALTFNAHRIHYDPGYATLEGLPERLVHGPLTAALLLDACAWRGEGATRAVLQALRPIPCGATLDITAPGPGEPPGATARIGGVAAMTLAIEADSMP